MLLLMDVVVVTADCNVYGGVVVAIVVDDDSVVDNVVFVCL